MNERWSPWHLAIPVAIALVIALLLVPATLASTPQRMHQMGTQPLDQLTGDAFDQVFLAHMSMHHAMGIAMTQPVMASGAHQELKDLGGQMMADQAREIGQMSEWLTAWYGVDAPWATVMPHPMIPDMIPGRGSTMPGTMHPGSMLPASGMPMTGAGPVMPVGQMGSMPTMSTARNPSPDQLDVAFITWMIAHHQAAIGMAALADERAGHQEVKDLAASIITTQSAEIATMRGWLADWYGL